MLVCFHIYWTNSNFLPYNIATLRVFCLPNINYSTIFEPIVALRIETRHLICCADQMTSFFKKFNTGLKRVKPPSFSCYCWADYINYEGDRNWTKPFFCGCVCNTSWNVVQFHATSFFLQPLKWSINFHNIFEALQIELRIKV